MTNSLKGLFFVFVTILTSKSKMAAIAIVKKNEKIRLLGNQTSYADK